MPAIYTVDASVFLNAFNPVEAGHAESRRFLEQLQDRTIPIIVPNLLLPEVAAVVSRGSGNETLAREFASKIERLPHLMLIPLDASLTRQAVDVAAAHHLRGSDAVYVAVALRFGAALVTLDREQHGRIAGALTRYYPAEALAEFE
jgi:predicted nucleic acid-binding protein